MNLWRRPDNWNPNYGLDSLSNQKPEGGVKMAVQYGSSCSLSEIANMGYGELDGKKLMTAFLKDCGLVTTRMDLKTKTSIPAIGNLTPMLIFSGVVEGPRNGAAGVSGPKSPFNGVTFAAYIRENGLGDVGTVNPMPNIYHANDRKTQAWVWAPDREAIAKWAAKNGLV